MSEITDRHRECSTEILDKTASYCAPQDLDIQRKIREEFIVQISEIIAKHFPEPSREPVAWMVEFATGVTILLKHKADMELYVGMGYSSTPLYK